MRLFLFLLLIILIFSFTWAEDTNLLLKVAQEQENIFWQNKENSYISWNIAVDNYTKLYQVYNNTKLQEKLVRLHIEGSLINKKNLNFFNFHYGYSTNYPLKVILLNLKDYPKFDLPIFNKTIPFFITIQNLGDKDLDLNKMKFYLENVAGGQEVLLNNEQIYRDLLKESVPAIPINKVLKSKDSFSFILIFSYNNRAPKLLRIENGNTQLNVIFFENIILIDPNSTTG